MSEGAAMAVNRKTIKDLRMEANMSTQTAGMPPEEEEVTFVRSNAAALLSLKLQLFGEIDVSTHAPIIFEVDGSVAKLPVKNNLVIGRRSADKSPQPDFDLGVFDAEKTKSVSRCHVKIERRDTLIYISDLSSRNGTWLNGQKMIPNAPRLLRDGDELHIGDLKIKVKFPPIKK
jgi:hypothetical protein